MTITAPILPGLAAAYQNSLEIYNAQLAAVYATGKGMVRLPAGDYYIAEYPGKGCALPMDIPGVRIEGEGPDTTTLILAPNSNCVAVGLKNISYFSFGGCSINANKDQQSIIKHAVRGESLSRGKFHDLTAFNAGAYGIGLQQGTFMEVGIEDFEVYNCGKDAIDIKDDNDNNYVWATRGLIRNWGLVPDEEAKAGLDVRGQCDISHIRFKEIGHKIGLRMRYGTVNHRADHSFVDDIRVEGEAIAGSVGVAALAANVSYSNLHVRACATGLMLASRGQRMVNVEAINCPTGLLLADQGFVTKPEDCAIDNLYVQGSSVAVDCRTARNTFNAPNLRSCAKGWGFNASGVGNRVMGGGLADVTIKATNAAANFFVNHAGYP